MENCVVYCVPIVLGASQSSKIDQHWHLATRSIRGQEEVELGVEPTQHFRLSLQSAYSPILWCEQERKSGGNMSARLRLTLNLYFVSSPSKHLFDDTFSRAMVGSLVETRTTWKVSKKRVWESFGF